MNDVNKELSEKIKQYRKIRRMTQEELAEGVGVTVDYIASVESGRRSPGLNTLTRACKCLRVAVSDVLPVADPDDGELRAQWVSEINETLNWLDMTQLGLLRAMICSLKP